MAAKSGLNSLNSPNAARLKNQLKPYKLALSLALCFNVKSCRSDARNHHKSAGFTPGVADALCLVCVGHCPRPGRFQRSLLRQQWYSRLLALPLKMLRRLLLSKRFLSAEFQQDLARPIFGIQDLCIYDKILYMQ